MARKTYYLRTDFFLRRQNNGKYETKMAVMRLFLAEKRAGFESGNNVRHCFISRRCRFAPTNVRLFG